MPDSKPSKVSPILCSLGGGGGLNGLALGTWRCVIRRTEDGSDPFEVELPDALFRGIGMSSNSPVLSLYLYAIMTSQC